MAELKSKNLINKIKDYFLGNNIIDCYDELKQKFPNETKQLNRERNSYIIFGKILPNIADISGIVILGFSHNPLYGGIIGAGEGLRNAMEHHYQYKLLDGTRSRVIKDIDNLIEILKEHDSIELSEE